MMLHLENLTKQYPTGDLALKKVSLKIPTGQVMALIGPSGAGKSTLIRCINRLIELSSGAIYSIIKTCVSLGKVHYV